MSVWEKIIGQSAAVEQLKTAATSASPTHAWLVSGPPGSGRSTVALAFAAALLCEQPDPQNRGCGTCKSCTTVLGGTHADLTHFTTENSSIKIEEARELVVKAQDRPSVGRWRVIIVEDADRMLERTSNVLLKAIEEPPPHTIWILSAPSPVDVLVTIRSRCRPVKLRVPALSEVVSLLESEGVSAEIATRVAALSQGNIGLARRLANSPDARERRESVVRMPLALTSISAAMRAAERLIEIADAEAEADAQARNDVERAQLMTTLGIEEGEKVNPSMRAQIRQLEDDQKRRAKRIKTDTLDRFLVDIQTVLRDVLSIQLGTGAALINVHLTQELQQFAARVPQEQTIEKLDAVALTRRRIATNASARLAFEAMMTSFVVNRA